MVREILDIHNKNEKDKKQAFTEDASKGCTHEEGACSSNSEAEENNLDMIKKPSKSLKVDSLKVASKMKKFNGEGHCHSDCESCSDDSCDEDNHQSMMRRGSSI